MKSLAKRSAKVCPGSAQDTQGNDKKLTAALVNSPLL